MWYFRKKAQDEKIRNPIQGEFFAAEAIDGPSEALVRESIQNSLDARVSDCVRVHIALYNGEDALPGGKVNDLFDDAWPHYSAVGNGLRADTAPRPGSSCPFLVVEDFGTKGLTGDPTQSDPDPDPNVKNPFFLFFRAEGLSGKSGTELGRWGIGKYVFARSSMASTHFGITVRHDDQRRMMLGAVTLKAHRIQGDKAVYSPDGIYGKRHGKDSDFVFPVEDPAHIDAICRLFRVTRRSEPGLSVVVPFVDPDITYERLLIAAAKDYFLPILNGRLIVQISAGAKHACLSADTIEDVAQQSAIGSGVRELIALVKYSMSVATRPEERALINPPDARRAARWADDLVSPEAFSFLKSKLDTDAPAAVRIPITVRSKEGGDQPSFFDVYFVRDKHSDGRPIFVRDGIVISDVRGMRAREIRSIVVIEDTPLSTMLGDSENPAHTQWQRDGSNFKGKYTYGPGVIQYVSESIGQLIAILSRLNAQADPSLTVDYFSIEPEDLDEETEDTETHKPKPKPGSDTEKPKPIIPARPSQIVIQRDKGGFSVQPGASPPKSPYLIDIRCAYDVRAGNPLRKWSAADFVLGSKTLPLTVTGHAAVVDLRANGALIRVDGTDYGVSVQGFDVNRDVYVRADVREAVNADQED
jgi:hypothetical protein